MAHSIIYVSDGTAGGLTKGKIASIVQGQSGQSITLEVRDLGNNLVDLTGYSTITGRKRDASGNVTALVGTLTLSGTPAVAPQVSFALDEDDGGESGFFTVIIILSNGVNTLKSFPATWHIQNDPAVNATTAAGTVGVTETQASLLATLATTTGLAEFNGTGGRTTIVIQAFMRTFLAAATAAAARIGLLPSYTSNANKVLAVNSGATDVEWVAQSGGGGAWGSITGTLSDQTDLQTALNGKETAGAAATVQGNLDTHTGATTTVHGIADTSLLLTTSAIGSTVQAHNANLTTIAGLSPSNDDVIQRKAGAWINRTVAQLFADILAGLASHLSTFLGSEDAAAARTAIGAGDTTEYIIVALSDETTALTTGTAKATFAMPYAMTLSGVIANVNTAPTGSALQVDINEGLSSILSTKLTIDATEKTSATAATPAVISDTALASGAEIIFDIDAVGSTIAGAGLKVTLIGTRA